jgi:UDP-glucose 4-epimerase
VLEKKVFTLFGNDYPTPDGTAIRNYIHVSDLAEGYVKALTYLNTHPGGHIFNLGTGLGISVKEVLDAVEQVAGIPSHIHIAPRRQGDVPILVASLIKAKNLIGFEHQYSDIISLVKTAWNWHKKQMLDR